MEIGVPRIVREALRSWVRVGIHICVRRGSSGRKSGRVGRGAILKGGIVVILGLIRIHLRRARGVAWNRGTKISVSLIVGMSVTIGDAVGGGVSLVDIRLVGTTGSVRWSHSPAERTKLVNGRDRKGRSLCREVLSETLQRTVDRNANSILQSSAGSYSSMSFDHILSIAVYAYRVYCSYPQ